MAIEIGKITQDKLIQKSYEVRLNPDLKEDSQKQLEATLNQSVQIADGLDSLANAFNKGIKFQVHDESERLYVEIVDRATGEVIKQIPPEEMLKIAAKFQEFLGLIVDEKA
ncbi:MAG: flagellar protein FlaG [Firmicutes bacterium]|nr:flagellar protein FlaG [Bacillota bacterium]MDD4263116.1 flagellar protein FlaG [Bacillota bacterium]MDD4693238.1 flagellar protein FlaG [Bacillota bacterium]